MACLMDQHLHLDPAYLNVEKSYPTPFANSTLLASLLVSLAIQKHSPDTDWDFHDEYDYVIVGAGAAGSVVASRISEIECATVLLLEAGPAAPLLTELPGIAHHFTDTAFDWKYFTEPLKHTGGAFKENRAKYPRGRMLGGTTSLNTMQYVRGNHKNYDEWEKAGATGWNFKAILQYFKRAEANADPKMIANGFHSTGGPMSVEKPRYSSEIKKPLEVTFEHLGYKKIDPNGANQTGIYNIQTFYKRGQRCSASKGYLAPVDNRNNLHIVTDAFVRQVSFENNQAVGVFVDFKNRTRFVRAKREVILSGGAINTPQILMLSGIGPAEDLKRLGIPLVADLPVGKHLQDHCATFQPYELSKKIDRILTKLTNPTNVNDYISFKNGPLASAGGRVMEVFVNDKIPNKYPDFPPLELFFTEASSELCRKDFNLKDEVYEAVFKPYEKKSFYLCQAQPTQPKSEGYVKLRTRNPYDHPLIDPNYLAEPEDFEHLIQGMHLCYTAASSSSMHKMGSQPFRTVFPGCENVTGNLDQYFRCVARLACTAFHHQVGTARMGRVDDPETVVDPELRVKNIRNLRVIDASIMPKIISGNTEAPTIMIGEKGAEMIKKAHGQCPITKSHIFPVKHHN